MTSCPVDVTAVILCWNDREHVATLLERLRQLEPAPSSVVVVDNGSVDAPEGLPGDPKLLRLRHNLGFAAAVNRGIRAALPQGGDRAAPGRWIWLLNSDVELPSDALGLLLRAASAPRTGMAAPLLLEAGGEEQARGGGRWNRWTARLDHLRGPGGRPDYLSGACLLLRAEMLGDVGLFDEGYFFYFEDVDLAFRARKAGWGLAVAADCRVVHAEASSLGRWSERRWFHLFRGLRRFSQAHAAMPRVAPCLRLLVHTATMLRRGRTDAVRGAWKAFSQAGSPGQPGSGPGGAAPNGPWKAGAALR